MLSSIDGSHLSKTIFQQRMCSNEIKSNPSRLIIQSNTVCGSIVTSKNVALENVSVTVVQDHKFQTPMLSLSVVV